MSNADWKLNGVTIITDGAEKRELLREVNVQFKAGQITLLLGSNGAGKSTLLESMAGIRKLQAGTIELGEKSLWVNRNDNKNENRKERTNETTKDIREENRKDKRKVKRDRLNLSVTLKLGIAMQNSESQWFAATVREEFLYSLKPYKVSASDAQRRMESALDEAGLDKELLERDPWTLSGGQQRRLSLACLLACEPDWLLLDEPTAGLDAEGIRRLCAVLQAHRAAGRGAVVATHDLDALLPLADALAVISGGAVREAAPAAALTHAAAAPQALRVLAKLHAEAALPPQAPARSGGAPWPAPHEVAAALAAELVLERPAREQLAGAGALASAEAMPALAELSPHAKKPSGDELQARAQRLQRAEAAAQRLERTEAEEQPNAVGSVSSKWLRADLFDPRALIVAYMLLATGVLALQSFLQLALAALIIGVFLMPFLSLIKPWLRVIRAYGMLIVLLCVIGGISFNPIFFEWEKALPTALRLSKLLLVMLLSMPMLKLMTPFRLQRAIEQAFGWLSRIHIPIHSFALLVTLIFRFIPLLTAEWERFAKLAHARGKAVTSLRSVPFSMLRSVLIPYIRSILRLAEQMADALEVRGFGNVKRKPTYGFRLHFSASDAIMIGIALVSFFLLFSIKILL